MDTAEPGPPVTEATPPADPLWLSINGEELMLAGRFDHWVPVAIEEGGTEGAVRMFIDVTGMAAAEPHPAGVLFSFTARTVERVGPFAWVATGLLRRGNRQRRVKALIQVPAAHGPFVAMTFNIDRERFADVWGTVAGLLAGRREGEHMAPRAWLRAPVPATA